MDIWYITELIGICLIVCSLIAFGSDIKYKSQVKYYTNKHERKIKKENGK